MTNISQLTRNTRTANSGGASKEALTKNTQLPAKKELAPAEQDSYKPSTPTGEEHIKEMRRRMLTRGSTGNYRRVQPQLLKIRPATNQSAMAESKTEKGKTSERMDEKRDQHLLNLTLKLLQNSGPAMIKNEFQRKYDPNF